MAARHNPWVQRLFQKSSNYCPSKILHAQLFHTFNTTSFTLYKISTHSLYLFSPVLEINKAICGWILEQTLLLALPRQSHTHHVMTFRTFARYRCDDGATVSREKSVQAFPPIFLQSCETQSGTESLGSRLIQHEGITSLHVVQLSPGFLKIHKSEIEPSDGIPVCY